MESQSGKKVLSFLGKGSELFGILIVNLLLTVITLGIYSFWGVAKTRKYLYQETEFYGNRFTFHGTGGQLFVGFLKAILIIIILEVPYFIAVATNSQIFIIIASIILFAGIILLIPVAIHGTLRYRLSRSSWRGIHFGYRGELKHLIGLFIKGILLSIITLGIYSFWFTVKLRKEIIDKIRFGNVTFKYNGTGGAYFLLNLKGLLLTIITLGIYSFWYFKDLMNYWVNNIVMIQNGRNLPLRSKMTGGKIFSLFVTNFLIVVFTLGIGTPWAIARTYRIIFPFLEMDESGGAFDPEKVVQTEEEYKNAMGDDMSGFLDIHFF